MGLRDEILEVLHAEPGRWTPAAVSWAVHRNAHGTLGQDPDPQVAVELAALVSEGLAAELPACPVCGRPGTLIVLDERVGEGDERPGPISGEEIGQTMEPLIAEGLIEVAEIVEFESGECCARTTRAWRRAPRPS